MHSIRFFGASVAALVVILLVTDPAAGQDLHPSRRLSPIGIARTHVGDAYVKVTYGRPYIRGREIFGRNTGDASFLVPFGEVWRTGANEATEITFTEPLLIDGERLEAGTYAVFTVPDENAWEIRFSPQLGLDGTGIFDPETGTFEEAYDPAQDVHVVRAPVQEADEVADPFTISFEDTPGGADLVFRWDTTVVRVPIQEAS